MEASAYEFNLNRFAEMVSSETGMNLDQARILISSGIYFNLGGFEEVTEQIILLEQV